MSTSAKKFLPMIMKLYAVSFIDDRGSKQFSGVYSSLEKAKEAATDALCYGDYNNEEVSIEFIEDTMKSNNVGNMCWQDYARLNEAPMNARKILEKHLKVKAAS